MSGMKEYLVKELKLILKKDIDYSKSDIQKILNGIIQLDEIQLSLYNKIRLKEKSKPNDITDEYYEKKISLNK
tara:strand:- start:298 stop:516 length:219 start_codon:yes stop_codon:yes gene_type:complete